MKRKLFILALVTVAAGPAAIGQVNVNVYSGHQTTGGGAPYSGLVGTFNSPDIQFGASLSWNWHPFGLGAFGADMTGLLDVSSTGLYAFTLVSDDGSQLYIDGTLDVNDGGAHGPAPATATVPLTAGIHAFEVQFFEDFGGDSGVDLTLPAGVTYVPDGGSTAAMLAGAVALFGVLRARRDAPRR